MKPLRPGPLRNAVRKLVQAELRADAVRNPKLPDGQVVVLVEETHYKCSKCGQVIMNFKRIPDPRYDRDEVVHVPCGNRQTTRGYDARMAALHGTRTYNQWLHDRALEALTVKYVVQTVHFAETGKYWGTGAQLCGKGLLGPAPAGAIPRYRWRGVGAPLEAL